MYRASKDQRTMLLRGHACYPGVRFRFVPPLALDLGGILSFLSKKTFFIFCDVPDRGKWRSQARQRHGNSGGALRGQALGAAGAFFQRE
jgi:hypothetical protein